MTEIKLKIADIIIELKSKHRLQPLNKKRDWRYKNFIYRGRKRSNIVLNIEKKTKASLPNLKNRVFTTVHPLSGEINWNLFKKKGNKYALGQYVPQKRGDAILNKDFSKGTIYLFYDKKSINWKLEDIIYNILQIILINYLSKKEAIFVHSIGLKDIDKSGFLFIGPTQSGKSTTARLWHRYSKAKVLNDDRMIIRKIKKKFYIFGTPWHGDFSDYLKSNLDKAKLKNIFFIYHNSTNRIDYLPSDKVFRYLYPNIFPIFWNKENLNKQVDLCRDLIRLVPSYRLGFKKGKAVISVVRSKINKN